MDLRLYYQKIRDMESKITEAFPVVVSNETADGGKPGVLTEVTPGIAAKMVVEGSARLASAAEAMAFRAVQTEAKRVADQEAAAPKSNVTLSSATSTRTEPPEASLPNNISSVSGRLISSWMTRPSGRAPFIGS